MHPLLDFTNDALLQQALTHRSYAHEHPEDGGDNERLEFLGDAILTFVSGEYLYHHHPDMGEDEMTRRRAALVDEKQLARFALAIGIDVNLRLGQGAMRDGGHQNPNLLSSALEAVIGAYYLDHGRDMDVLRPLIEQLFDSVPDDVTISRSQVDWKNQFQAWVQAQGKPSPPQYVTERISGPDHAPIFISTVFSGDRRYGQGQGNSKKESEKQAAKDALRQLRERVDRP